MSIPLANREGIYSLEKLPAGWANAEVAFTRSNGTLDKRTEILDFRADEKNPTRYLHEPMVMIAFKCFELALVGFPLYFAVYSMIHLIRLPIVTFVSLSPQAFFKQLWTLVRIPFYAIACEFAAIYGIFRPLEGRALVGYYEGELHEKTRRDSYQYGKDNRSSSTVCWETFSLENDPHTFFAAFCMQPIGKITDPNVVRHRILSQPENSPVV